MSTVYLSRSIPGPARGTSFGCCLRRGAARLTLLVLACAALAAKAAEFRAFWVDAWGDGFLNQSQVDTLLGVPGTSTKGQIRNANCNAVILAWH